MQPKAAQYFPLLFRGVEDVYTMLKLSFISPKTPQTNAALENNTITSSRRPNQVTGSLAIVFARLLIQYGAGNCKKGYFESRPPLHLNAVRLRCSQFSQNISQHFTATCHYRRFTITEVIYLSSFVEDLETTEPCCLNRVKNGYNVLLGAL